MFSSKSIKLDFGKFTKTEQQSLVRNKLSLSLLMSRKFLVKIPERMDPTGKSNNRLEFEMMTEGLLFFFIGARDALLQKINEKLQLGLDEDEVELSKILTCLDQNISNQKNIYDLLHNITQPPKKLQKGWERSKSWLWEINHIRNRIAHTGIIKGAIVAGPGLATKQSMIIYDQHGNYELDPIKEPKPKIYFEECIKKFEKLNTQIEQLLP